MIEHIRELIDAGIDSPEDRGADEDRSLCGDCGAHIQESYR